MNISRAKQVIGGTTEDLRTLVYEYVGAPYWMDAGDIRVGWDGSVQVPTYTGGSEQLFDEELCEIAHRMELNRAIDGSPV